MGIRNSGGLTILMLQESRLTDTRIPIQDERTAFTAANGPEKTINGLTFGRAVSQSRGDARVQDDRLTGPTGYLDIELCASLE
jgi:hypothetical protein